MENSGWIKLHRQIMENEYWLSEPFTRAQAWIDLLLLASHNTVTIRKRGILIEIKRGEIGYSEESLAMRWKWSRGKVRRFLFELKTKNAISRNPVQQNKNLSSLIYIVNYDYYQSSGTTSGTTNGTRNKKEKKEKKKHMRESEDGFASFYESYPVRKGKQPALKAWSKLNPGEDLKRTIMQAIKLQERHKAELKERNQFCPEWPYPATWLNQHRWEDEVKAEQSRWEQ